MSGGAFDYAFSRVLEFADELAACLDDHEKVDKYGSKPDAFEPATLAKLREIEKTARKTAALMHEAEWLYSSNTGEESFIERVKKIEEEFK